MSYQMRSASSTGAGMGAGVGAGVGAGDRGSQAFRSSRNDLASTLKAGALAAHEMRSAIPRASAAASPYSAGHAVAASASSSSLLPAIGGATPRSAFAPTAPHGSPSRPAGSASAAFPSTDKEESKESGGSSSSAGASAASKEKDWNLWHGAPEAQWILSVLDDISHKLTLASLLTPEILKDKVCDSLDAELLLTLKEHFQVENQYHEFLDSDLWKQNAHEPKNQELFRELDLCLADSTRTVTRLLKQHPALVRRLRELGLKRSSATLDFLNTFSRLRGLVHAKLRMTAEEERNMREQLAELKVLEEEDTHRFVELTERLAVERNEHEHALAEKERKITRLSAQIAQLTQRTQQERQMFEEKMREDNEAAEKAFKAAEKDLLKQLDSLTSQLETDGSENFRAELLYHRKKNLRALDVSHLIDKYDVDMTLKHESVVDMAAAYNKEKAELDALNGYFEVRDEEERKVAEEHRRIREERDRELVIERKNQQAALLVQSLYKPYYAKNGPKEPKAKKTKKKKDPFAGLRGRPKSSKPAEGDAAAASSATGSATPAASPAGGLGSPSASGPEDSEGEATQGEHD